MREWKTWHQMTLVENAGVENSAPDDRDGKRESRQHWSVRAVRGFIQELICGSCKSQGGGRSKPPPHQLGIWGNAVSSPNGKFEI